MSAHAHGGRDGAVAGEPGAPSVALRAEGLSRTFGSGAVGVRALADVSLSVPPGRLVVVTGPSGSGKTTLLHLLGGLDRPTSGRVWLGPATDGGPERELTAMPEEQVLAARREEIGYVFQSFGLVPVLSAAENVEVPLRLARTAPAERAARVARALGLVGLAGHAAQRPYELSGGQQQRVGIARALVAAPRVLLADEPTGQLDSGTARTIMDLVHGLVRGEGLAAVVSTHDPELVERADHVLRLHDGRLVDER
ncbi:ABC transporter ATP-binding protein [Xylanimonas oleitrophica]|uniref:ABC transporter ATP-binding protein n=1 Tax=Xylanimonas oleitrophica TaxID=2607479 RepID=A0A2W5WUB3_9MICO|nr:ABC transporter ATP-binding protein [Xylanimonas oleitrophica]PZR55069.1 ABC transporter ATP-binding protein [Xylanimonas oleitrophica]